MKFQEAARLFSPIRVHEIHPAQSVSFVGNSAPESELASYLAKAFDLESNFKCMQMSSLQGAVNSAFLSSMHLKGCFHFYKSVKLLGRPCRIVQHNRGIMGHFNQ